MKQIKIMILAAFVPACLFACHGNKSSSNADTGAMKTDTSARAVKIDSAAGAMGDTAFASKVALGGMAEVALGKMAVTKSSDKKIKDFGKMMIDEHSKANADLNAVAKSKNMTLPASLDKEHQAKSDSLGQLSGKDFDKAYIGAMIEGHQKMLALMQNEAKNGRDPDFKNFADRTEPVVQMHLSAIKKIRDSHKGL